MGYAEQEKKKKRRAAHFVYKFYTRGRKFTLLTNKKKKNNNITFRNTKHVFEVVYVQLIGEKKKERNITKDD